jgi:predicted enzyme related to lactoylglutathione lyase
MSERDRYPAGVPCWVEALEPDPEAAIEFYGSLFGWEAAGPGEMPGDPPGKYYVARSRGRDAAGIGSRPDSSDPSLPGWMTHIRVESADRSAELVKEAGGSVIAGPLDALPAGRLAVVADPMGARFCLWEAGLREGAQVINEPGAWAMSMLRTDDPAGAAAFYGAVCGWQVEPFGPPAAQIALCRLPGYVGGEPDQPVPRDVVAAIAASGDESASHWSVDFWVKDADATSEHAMELGGQVVVAPHDRPGFRGAVIADPQGAVLSISALVQ